MKKAAINLFFFMVISLFLFSEDFNLILKDFSYRNLGPYKVGSWISCIAVPETDNPSYKYTFYVGARNGGVWKTTNNGTTFFPIFDNQESLSIGAIAVDPVNPEIVWVGTGETYNARLSHPGDGVYKSEDRGKNWKNMGLRKTEHIAKILINPKNPNIVYVAAMGKLFSSSEERGVYKTVDGGKTWEKVFYLDENTGVIDIVMNPENPDIIYIASYEKYRFPWHFEAGGEKSGIYKTTDGGKNWEKLTNGLPEGKLGRIGLALYRKNPKIIYALIENLNPKPGYKRDKKQTEFNKMKDPYFDSLIGGELYKSVDGGKSWKKMNSEKDNLSSKAAYSFNKVIVDQNDPNHLFVLSMSLHSSFDGGKTWIDLKWNKEFFRNMFGDVRTFWIDPKDSRHILVGSDGGLYVSYDGGKTVDHLYNIPLGEIYAVEADMAYPYNIYVGLQDHEVWKGPSNGWAGMIMPEDWNLVGKWDGMYTKVDPKTNRWAYTTTQFGGHLRVDMLKGERVDIEPKVKKGEPMYRFPWTPVILISHFDNNVLYAGSQYLLKSKDRGDHWKKISPDLTTNNPEKIAGKGHMMYCTITTISESPLQKGLLWVGTDDGRVFMTPNDGKKWIEFTKKLSKLGCPSDFWVTRVLASNHSKDIAYVVKSGFKFDKKQPCIFRTDDGGNTWKNISSNLPKSPVNVIVEDKINPDLIFVGNNKGVYVSFNRGLSWYNFNQNIPKVPVNDLLIHPREKDLIVGTYGRGAFITDISPLEELTENILKKSIYIFNIKPKPQLNYSQRRFWGNFMLMGDRPIFTPNEINGVIIYIYSKKAHKNPFDYMIKNENRVIYKSAVKLKRGLNRIILKTEKIKPGEYLFIINFKGKLMKKKFKVYERFFWPVGLQTLRTIKSLIQ